VVFVSVVVVLAVLSVVVIVFQQSRGLAICWESMTCVLAYILFSREFHHSKEPKENIFLVLISVLNSKTG